jgi:hypothetical protein
MSTTRCSQWYPGRRRTPRRGHASGSTLVSLGALAWGVAAASPVRAGEHWDGKTEARVLVDDPRAKQLSISTGMGIFGYNTYTVGGYGLDVTYAAPYVFAVSAKGFAAVNVRTDSDDHKIRPFYDGTAYLNLSDRIAQEAADIRIYGAEPWTLYSGGGRSVPIVPAKTRNTYSLRGGAFSWGSVSPTLYGGLAFTETRYLTAYLDELDTDRTHSSNWVVYLDAVFPTMNQTDGPNDRVGGKLGVEFKERNVGTWWNGWGAMELGYLRRQLNGRFVIGLTL